MNKIIRIASVFALSCAALLYVGCTKDFEGDINALETKTEATQVDLEKLAQTVEAYNTAARASIEQNAEAIQANAGNINENAEAIEALEVLLGKKVDQTAFDGLVKTLNENLGLISETAISLGSKDADLQTQINKLSERIEAVNTTLKTTIGKLDEKVELYYAEYKAEVKKIWGAISGVQGRITSLVVLPQSKSDVCEYCYRGNIDTVIFEVPVAVKPASAAAQFAAAGSKVNVSFKLGATRASINAVDEKIYTVPAKVIAGADGQVSVRTGIGIKFLIDAFSKYPSVKEYYDEVYDYYVDTVTVNKITGQDYETELKYDYDSDFIWSLGQGFSKLYYSIEFAGADSDGAAYEIQSDFQGVGIDYENLYLEDMNYGDPIMTDYEFADYYFSIPAAVTIGRPTKEGSVRLDYQQVHYTGFNGEFAALHILAEPNDTIEYDDTETVKQAFVDFAPYFVFGNQFYTVAEFEDLVDAKFDFVYDTLFIPEPASGLARNADAQVYVEKPCGKVFVKSAPEYGQNFAKIGLSIDSIKIAGPGHIGVPTKFGHMASKENEIERHTLKFVYTKPTEIEIDYTLGQTDVIDWSWENADYRSGDVFMFSKNFKKFQQKNVELTEAYDFYYSENQDVILREGGAIALIYPINHKDSIMVAYCAPAAKNVVDTTYALKYEYPQDSTAVVGKAALKVTARPADFTIEAGSKTFASDTVEINRVFDVSNAVIAALGEHFSFTSAEASDFIAKANKFGAFYPVKSTLTKDGKSFSLGVAAPAVAEEEEAVPYGLRPSAQGLSIYLPKPFFSTHDYGTYNFEFVYNIFGVKTTVKYTVVINKPNVELVPLGGVAYVTPVGPKAYEATIKGDLIGVESVLEKYVLTTMPVSQYLNVRCNDGKLHRGFDVKVSASESTVSLPVGNVLTQLDNNAISVVNTLSDGYQAINSEVIELIPVDRLSWGTCNKREFTATFKLRNSEDYIIDTLTIKFKTADPIPTFEAGAITLLHESTTAEETINLYKALTVKDIYGESLLKADGTGEIWNKMFRYSKVAQPYNLITFDTNYKNWQMVSNNITAAELNQIFSVTSDGEATLKANQAVISEIVVKIPVSIDYILNEPKKAAQYVTLTIKQK